MKREEVRAEIKGIIDAPDCQRCADDNFEGDCPYYKPDEDGNGFHCEEPDTIDRIMDIVDAYKNS